MVDPVEIILLFGGNFAMVTFRKNKRKVNDRAQRRSQLMAEAGNEAGLELVGPDEWPVLKKYGLTSALPWGAGKGITEGFNNPALHD